MPHFTQVVPGELTIVTGLPNSGKSEWLDALAMNLARQHGWRIALCSLENSARDHGRKLMEKFTGAIRHGRGSGGYQGWQHTLSLGNDTPPPLVLSPVPLTVTHLSVFSRQGVPARILLARHSQDV